MLQNIRDNSQGWIAKTIIGIIVALMAFTGIEAIFQASGNSNKQDVAKVNGEDITQTELSQAAGRDKSSLTPVIEALVRRGLVERKRLDHDRRAYRLTLTLDGKKTLATMMRCARRHEKNLDRIIGARDRARFLATLKKLAAGFGS